LGNSARKTQERQAGQPRLQCRLNSFLASFPEKISMKDNLVDRTVVADLPLDATGRLANGGL